MWVLERRSWLWTVFLGGRALKPVILGRTLLVTALSGVVTVIDERVPSFHMSLTTTPFSLIGVALGIFLGFRNSAAYDRFWEARKLWGALVNTARSWTRQALTMVEGPLEARTELVHLLIAFVHALKHHLRGTEPWQALAALLPEATVAALKGEVNVPVAIVHQMGERLRQLRQEGALSEYLAVVLEGSLVALTDIQGACERIKATPVPYSYSVLMHRLVAGYCVLLPLGLADSVGRAMPLVVAGISYTLFGLDAVGDEIEQPFGTDGNDLPLDQLTVLIERIARQRLGEPLPDEVVPVRGQLR